MNDLKSSCSSSDSFKTDVSMENYESNVMRMKIKFGERFNFVVYDKRPETDAKRKKPQIKRSYCNIGVSRVRRVDDNSQPTVNDDSSSNNSIVDSQDSLGTI